jgi:hypothetical protein
MFTPHPNLSDQINSNIVQSEIEGGVYLYELPVNSLLEVETRNRSYKLKIQRDGDAYISGHPEICPEPVLVHINGSNWGGSMIKLDYVGRGMHLEFIHPDYQGVVVTSRIVDVRLLQQAA